MNWTDAVLVALAKLFGMAFFVFCVLTAVAVVRLVALVVSAGRVGGRENIHAERRKIRGIHRMMQEKNRATLRTLADDHKNPWETRAETAERAKNGTD